MHGGATLRRPGSAPTSPASRPSRSGSGAEKGAIAERAADAGASPASAIALSPPAPPPHALAPHLADVPGLTVVTNSIPVADVLYQRRRADQTVVLTGGIRTPSDALVGPVAEAAIRALTSTCSSWACTG